jgi:hypothetical protein
MFQAMPSARALLATVLCAGMGLAAAHVPVKTTPRQAATLCAAPSGPTITCRACPAADPAVSVAAVAPARPAVRVVAGPQQLPAEDAPTARVLDVAPKTSPPRA